MNKNSTSLLDKILLGELDNKAFAILKRGNLDYLELMSGPVSHHQKLDMIQLSDVLDDTCKGTLVILPYNQIRERNFCCVNDNAKLVSMEILDKEFISTSDFKIPDDPICISEGGFDIEDKDYENIVQSIINEAIGTGEGSNFVIKRNFNAKIDKYSLQKALTILQHLIQNERGAYWTFLVHLGSYTLVGASPELHVKLENNVVTMNPISGTYRYPPSGPTLDGLLSFLSNSKERDELYMVVEEELKMVGRLCSKGGKIIGPFLKEMSRLAHTEYLIQGESVADPREILRETMFSPAVTGSPLENACRMIAKYEPMGRGYYGGALALITRDVTDNFSLDSAILIRTAYLDSVGNVEIKVGATIVRHSEPASEAAETRAKAKALLKAMQYNGESYNVRKSPRNPVCS